MCAVALLVVVASGCNFITNVSSTSTGDTPNCSSYEADISADGRFVAFASCATNLLGAPSSEASTDIPQIFVRDLRTGRTVLASISTTGDPGNLYSQHPRISGDGRYVVFETAARNLAPGGPVGEEDVGIVLRDLQARKTTGIAARNAFGPSISADGRRLAYQSRIISDEPDVVVVVDPTGGSVGLDPFRVAGKPVLSGDGRHLAFEQSVLLDDGNVTPPGLFVMDLDTRAQTVVLPDFRVAPEPSLSSDGRFITFTSSTDGLVPDDHNGLSDVFVRDLQASTTTRVSVDMAGGDPDGTSGSSDISGDGRYVVFDSDATDLVAGDTNGTTDAFVRDLRTGTTTVLNVDGGGTQLPNGGFSPSISADGRYAAYGVSLGAGPLAPSDVSARSIVEPTVASISPKTLARGATATFTVTGTGFLPGTQVATSVFQADGGVTVRSATVLSETRLRVSLTAAPDAPATARNIVAFTPGTGPGGAATGYGFCTGCLTIT
jgi:Tol biopolymer transport system component